MNKQIELLSMLNAFGAAEFNPQVSVSDWTHCETRKTEADTKRARKLLRNKNAQERINEFN